MITVTVSGKAYSGKSSVAYVLANTLLGMGFAVDVKFLDGESMHDVSKNVDEKLISIKDKQSISIVEVGQDITSQVNEKKKVSHLSLVK